VEDSIMRVLIIDDDSRTARLISMALRENGHDAAVLHDGDEAVETILGVSFDAVVLDIMLPGQDGLSILRQVRTRGNQTPVLLLSARGEVNDRVEGLNAGADDYLPKPFALSELLARLGALTRRATDAVPKILRMADLELNTIERTAIREGRTIELTNREYQLLEYLMRSAGRVCTRMMIFEQVWKYRFDPGSNLVEVYVRKLRDKIDRNATLKLFHNVRGEGYLMKEQP
jgi:DNA-binding response OmpR family regulator